MENIQDIKRNMYICRNIKGIPINIYDSYHQKHRTQTQWGGRECHPIGGAAEDRCRCSDLAHVPQSAHLQQTPRHRRGGAAEDHCKCADLAHGLHSAHLQQTPRHRRGGAAEDCCNCADLAHGLQSAHLQQTPRYRRGGAIRETDIIRESLRFD